MIKRICDCCGEEVKKDFVKFYITYTMADPLSGNSNEAPIDTPYREYCVKCFNDLLVKRELGKIRTIKD